MSRGILVFALLFFLAPLLIILFWYLKKKHSHSLQAGLSLGLFLVSTPEGQKKENEPEASKNFIAEFEKFLSGLTSLRAGWLEEKLWGRPAFALELAAHNTGSEIFFYVAFPRNFQTLLSNQLHGAFPEAKIEAVKDYNIFNPEGASAGAVLALTNSSLLPTKTYQELGGDPLETITSAFSKLDEYGEGAALQIVLRPAGGETKSRARKAIEKLKEGKSPKEVLGEGGFGEAFKEIALGSTSSKKDELKTQDSRLR
ncbi:MAG: hypothetical protein AAB730_01775 [Patescibacteria group bacterium]